MRNTAGLAPINVMLLSWFFVQKSHYHYWEVMWILYGANLVDQAH